MLDSFGETSLLHMGIGCRTLLTHKGVENVLGYTSPWTSCLSSILRAAYLPFALDLIVRKQFGKIQAVSLSGVKGRHAYYHYKKIEFFTWLVWLKGLEYHPVYQKVTGSILRAHTWVQDQSTPWVRIKIIIKIKNKNKKICVF